MMVGEIQIGFRRPGIVYRDHGQLRRSLRAFCAGGIPQSLDDWLREMWLRPSYPHDLGWKPWISDVIREDTYGPYGTRIRVILRRLAARRGYLLSVLLPTDRPDEEEGSDELERDLACRLESPRAVVLSAAILPPVDEHDWHCRVDSDALAWVLGKVLGWYPDGEEIAAGLLGSGLSTWSREAGLMSAHMLLDRGPARVWLSLVASMGPEPVRSGESKLPFWLEDDQIVVRPKWWTQPRFLISWLTRNGDAELTDRPAIEQALSSYQRLRALC